MIQATADLKEIHWLMDMLQNIDVGLVVLDRDYNIQVWNSFMENHSGITPGNVINKNIFKLFPDVPQEWFKRKLETVFLLNNRGFTIWEQRSYLFRFKNYRPITNTADFMYQNTTLIPLLSADGKVNHVGIIIYDVTSVAISSQRLQQANQQLEHLSRTDRLTQLLNRGYWEECLRQEYNRIRRTGVVSSLVIFDIDHFKNINDSFGHQAGDDVIRMTAQKLMDTQRNTDISGRYGGEEFVIILIETGEEGALFFAERLRKIIEALTIEYEENRISYTVSLGIAEYSNDLKDYNEWLERADRALYKAKNTGRNRSITYSASELHE
jgi:diguanylate cyclase (GGDEF)-like protein